MKVVRIDHIGIAVRELGSIGPLLRLLFGEHAPRVEIVPDQRVRATAYPVGDSTLEFLEEASPGGPIGRYLASRGNGIHHIALEVEDLEAALAELRDAGVPLIDRQPRLGAGGKKIAFLHPKGSGGILIELSEAPRPR